MREILFHNKIWIENVKSKKQMVFSDSKKKLFCESYKFLKGVYLRLLKKLTPSNHHFSLQSYCEMSINIYLITNTFVLGRY